MSQVFFERNGNSLTFADGIGCAAFVGAVGRDASADC